MVSSSPASSTSERATKYVSANKVCFNNLRINTQYKISIQPYNGVLAGPEVSKLFFQPEIEDVPNTTETAVKITEDPLSTEKQEPIIDVGDLSDEQQNELVQRGREFVRQFTNWHKFQYTQWQEAINRYVPYLEARLEEGQTLKNPNIICPDPDIAPSRCLQSQTIIDHNGCQFTFCFQAEEGKYLYGNLVLQL